MDTRGKESPGESRTAGPPPAARRVLETSLYVSDIERARGWYRRVLGLEELIAEAPRHVFFRLENGMLLLFDARESRASGEDVPPHGASGSVHAAFACRHQDLPAWRRHLEVSGVEIAREVEWPGGARSLYFHDPDGNLLELATPDLWGLPAPAGE